MRISDWSSDVCSSDLGGAVALARDAVAGDAPQQSADNRAADGVAMAAAADHVGIVARVISAAIGAVVIGIIRRRRIVDAGASLDRAFVAPLVTATVARLIDAAPAPGPAPLRTIVLAVHRARRRRARTRAGRRR